MKDGKGVRLVPGTAEEPARGVSYKFAEFIYAQEEGITDGRKEAISKRKETTEPPRILKKWNGQK